MDGFNKEIRIVLIGKTGTGKSSTGNTILNQERFEAKCQVLAVTDKSSYGTRILNNNKKLIVVDTPGILDTHRDRKVIKEEIIRSIGICVPGPHAVLYVMRIGDRLTDDEKNCIQIFTDMFGEDIFNFVIVVFTKGKDLEDKTLTQYFQEAPHLFQKLLRKCSNRMLALDNKGTACEKTKAVDNLLGMINSMNSGQSYYSDDMLKSATVAFTKRLKEIGQVDDVRREIEVGGPAFDYVWIAVGVGGLIGAFFASIVIAPAIAAVNVGGAAVVAAETVGSAVASANAGGAAVVAANTGGAAVVAANTGGAAVVAANTGGAAVVAANAGGAAVVAAKAGGFFSMCSIL